MTDRKINIAIAEACGIISKDQWGPLYKIASGWVRDCPDYANDLNAMHEAENRLCKLEFGWRTYADALEDVVGVNGSWAIMDEADKRLVLQATARQRAKAFLRTICKCKEVRP